ncbi:MAG: carbohydrate ABC transporter permease [Eubacteriales bacterium]|nr:carbohydrate ABC transporter permease [Eubacteriales bacterium]
MSASKTGCGRTRRTLLKLVESIVLFLSAFVVIYPMAGVLFASFKTKAEYFTTSSIALPKSFLYLNNFATVISEGNLLRAFFNTGLMIVLACFFSTIICTMVAYVFSRFQFFGKQWIDRFYTAASFVPSVIVHLIIYRDFAGLGLTNKLISIVILYAGVDIISLYLYRQYFDQISKSLDEAAMLEGCSYARTYWSILLPVMKPAITTACILKTIAIYNDFYTSSLYLNNLKAEPVMSTVLYNFIGVYSAEWNNIAAGVLLISLPMFIGFVLMQKFIYKGFSDGAVKG